ncbi:forespore regulator of the sigma-K checkpoint [Evansella caseinilytica]|uniref:Forespore regulator of the sigma-K checkpoint n=1 Tax=Evansella caseinilytica TaxID=1503961 RepID=A0A1H3K652_9BACI|nr:intercompartmental signaling factor BofC [Evansella caseinilytica]SDY47088.1 forespore regulator of the sigma-K checkpoint [Evansella caseinilytica]
MNRARTFSNKGGSFQLYLRLFLVTFSLFLYLSLLAFTVSAESRSATSVDNEPKSVEVILQRQYLDGEISEEIVLETIWSMEDFWAYYHDWQLIDQNDVQVIFRKELNDISPLLKINGYFGLAEDGTLNIYNGKPEDNNVIQSFFQVNTSRLKSHLHQDLLKGIPVTSKDHYIQVLKMVEKYAVTEM